jgi:hypothetical protein
MQDGCQITDPILLSVRHVKGRTQKEITKKKRYNRGQYKHLRISYPYISEDLFQKHLKNGNYNVFCINHGRVFEWGPLRERLYKGNRDTQYRIKRYIHRLFLIGRKCSICGETDYNYLCGHHKEVDGKDDRALINMTNQQFQELYKANKLECLCVNCHTLMHYRERKNKKITLLDYCIK